MMPAYRERLYICPGQDGEPAWIVDFPIWWQRGGFFEKYGDRRLDTGNPFYVDYGLLLAGWEALEWDRQCREAFVLDERANLAAVVEAMRELDTKLQSASWVVVESYEWESGLE